MRKRITKAAAAAMVGAMALSSLAGCGSDASSTTAAATEKATEKATEAEKETEKAEEDTTAAEKETEGSEKETGSDNGSNAESVDYTQYASTEDKDSYGQDALDHWEPFAEKVTITIPVYDRSQAGLPAVDDNYWTQWVQKHFGDPMNIEVKYVAIPRNDVMTKYSTLIASGDQPTLMMEFDYPKVSQWANDGAMQPIDLEAFKEIAPTYYQKMADSDTVQYSTINDDTYFVFAERPATYTWITVVRKDWLDEVGMELPESYEEYTAAIDAIMEAGLCGDYPIGIYLPTAAYITNFGFRDYPVNEEEWAIHSSLGTPAFTMEATKRMLKRQNDEYHKGYYSTEYDLDADGSQAKADFINGKTFSYSGYTAADCQWLNEFYENNPDAELALASHWQSVEEGVTADHPVFRTDNPYGMAIGFSANATEDELKAAWMYLEWMSQPDVLFTLENGYEGKQFDFNEEGLPELNTDYEGDDILNYSGNADMTTVVHASREYGTIEQRLDLVSPKGVPQDLSDEIIQRDAEWRELVEEGYGYTDPQFSVTIDSEAEYSATLLSLWQEYSVELTKCDPSEFDSLYEELSQEFLDAGYQEILDERLEAYQNGQTSHLPDSVQVQE